jgi:hypothetical protein
MVRVTPEKTIAITLADITRREVNLYAAYSPLATMYRVADEEQQIYAVIIIEDDPEQRPAWVVVMAQVVGDCIVILEDRTDKPLVDALMINGGVPRDKIVLAYRGESLPDSKSK